MLNFIRNILIGAVLLVVFLYVLINALSENKKMINAKLDISKQLNGIVNDNNEKTGPLIKEWVKQTNSYYKNGFIKIN